MKVYISHPIAGKNWIDIGNFEASGIAYAMGQLNADIEDILLPRQIDPWCKAMDEPSCPPGRRIDGDEHTIPCYMRGDLLELIQCDAILMMPGWEQSAGCRDEINLAMICSIPIHFYK